jgi:tetratricopeptide (TPR) repeat protein
MLQEMRFRFAEAKHPEWLEETKRRVAAFEWDVGGDGSGAYDPRRFGARAAMYDAEAHAARGRWPTALQTYHEALQHLKSLVAEYPGVRAYREDLARARFGSATVLLRMRFNDEAMGEARKALALVVPEAGQRVSPTVVVTMVKAAEALTEAVLAIGLVPDGVVEMVDRAVAAMPVVEDKAADEAAAEWVGRLERVRAQLLTVGGKSGMAIAAARRSVALARRGMALSGGGGHQVYRLSEALVAESVAAASVGDEALALASLEEATKLLSGQVPEAGHHMLTGPCAELAKAWGGRAERLEGCGKVSEAVISGAAAVDWWTRAVAGRLDDRAVNSLLSRQQLRQAELLKRAGGTAAAKEMAEQAYAGFRRILGSYKGGHSATSLSCAEAAIEVAELEGNTGAEAWLAAADAALKRPRGAKERLVTGQRELLERLEKRLAALGTRVAGQ